MIGCSLLAKSQHALEFCKHTAWGSNLIIHIALLIPRSTLPAFVFLAIPIAALRAWGREIPIPLPARGFLTLALWQAKAGIAPGPACLAAGQRPIRVVLRFARRQYPAHMLGIGERPQRAIAGAVTLRRLVGHAPRAKTAGPVAADCGGGRLREPGSRIL